MHRAASTLRKEKWRKFRKLLRMGHVVSITYLWDEDWVTNRWELECWSFINYTVAVDIAWDDKKVASHLWKGFQIIGGRSMFQRAWVEGLTRMTDVEEKERKRALLVIACLRRAGEVAEERIRAARTIDEVREYLKRLRSYEPLTNKNV